MQSIYQDLEGTQQNKLHTPHTPHSTHSTHSTPPHISFHNPTLQLRSSRFNLTGIDNAEKAEDLFVDILNGWSEEMQLDQFTILGHSFGAYLASCFAMRHPEKLNGLVLADPHGVPKKPEK